MICSYLNCKGLADVDVRFCFCPGQAVLRLARREGKLSLRTWGPYTFIKHGKTHTAAEIRDQATGKHVVVSVAHLRPMMAERAIRMQCYPIRQVVDAAAVPSHASEDPTTESSTSDSETEVIRVRDRKRSW